MTSLTLFDQTVGCILAGVLGDAMGGPYEGCTGPVDYRPPDNEAISDDTQLTLATCEAISEAISTRRVNPQPPQDLSCIASTRAVVGCLCPVPGEIAKVPDDASP